MLASMVALHAEFHMEVGHNIEDENDAPKRYYFVYILKVFLILNFQKSS